MILTWMLLCLALVAAFPKGYKRSHTDRLQTGSGMTTQAGGQARPVPMPWKTFSFKKISQDRKSLRPSGSSGTSVQAASRRPVKSWELFGKGRRRVHSRPPPVPVQPWIIPVHGHHLPMQRILVLTGNNVISLRPEGPTTSEGKITQLFLTSGNNGVSLLSSGSLPSCCRLESRPSLDFPKPHTGTTTKEVELGLELQGIKTDEKLKIEGLVPDVFELVKGDDLVLEGLGEVSESTGVLEGEIFGTKVVPAAILVEDALGLEKDQLAEGIIELDQVIVHNLEEKDQLAEGIMELDKVIVHNLEVVAEEGLREAEKLHDAIVVFQNEENDEPATVEDKHFSAHLEEEDLEAGHQDLDILALSEASDHAAAAVEGLGHSNVPDVAVDVESEKATSETLFEAAAEGEQTVQAFLGTNSNKDLDVTVAEADLADADEILDAVAVGVEIESEKDKDEALTVLVSSENAADHHNQDMDDVQNAGVAVVAEDLKDTRKALDSVEVESEKETLEQADHEDQTRKEAAISIDTQVQSNLDEKDSVDILESIEPVNEEQKDSNLEVVVIEDIKILDELLDKE